MLLSILSPVYRSEKIVVPLYERISAVASRMADFADYEIVLVEDCGGDRSWEVIQELAAKDKHVVALRLSRNFGQHHALTAGLSVCRGEWVVMMDCDLQDDPDDMPALWQEARKGYLIVNARRIAREHAVGRRLASRAYYLLLEHLSGLAFDPQVANYRIMHRRVVDAFLAIPEATRAVGLHLQWLGFKTGSVDVRQVRRLEGGSTYTVRKLFALAANSIVSYSNKPLQYSIGLGLVMAASSLLFTCGIFVRALFWGIPVLGWASLMVSLWFIGGIIVANLGIIGIYIGKIYDETKRRPLYVIAERINC